MQAAELTQGFPAIAHWFPLGGLTVSSAELSLPFSPVKLICLVAWVYLCLYFVQIIQFSPLVSKKFKPIANIITLFVGPLLLLALLIFDAAKKSSQGDLSLLEVLKEQIRTALANLRSQKTARQQEVSAIRLLDSSGRTIDEIYGHSSKKAQRSRILELTEQIIGDALQQRASDILIDPKDEATYTIRFRIDGVLRIVRNLKSDTCQAVVNSIKAVSGMDIAEKRRPQDGAFIVKKGQATSSFRVASAGVLNGEKLSIRVLNQNAGTFTLAEIGFTDKQLSVIKSAIGKPSGMMLMCGPTGSGKTTTLYAALQELNKPDKKIVTAEDPVEYNFTGMNQCQVKDEIGLTFDSILRAMLRQAPNIILVGEIRDGVVADVAIQAALTGHLVFSTLHTNDAPSAITRLIDMGVKPFLVASSIQAIMAQRLLRVICKNCKVVDENPDPHYLRMLNITPDDTKKHPMYKGEGCSQCQGTGFKGRIGTFEMVELNNEIRELAFAKAPTAELRKAARASGMRTLMEDGKIKIFKGITTPAEVTRIAQTEGVLVD